MSAGEAMFSFTTKVRGDLLTVRGNTEDEFRANAMSAIACIEQLAELHGFATAFTMAEPAVEDASSGASTPAPAQAPQQWEPPRGPAPSGDAPQQGSSGVAPHCAHGPRTYREGTGNNGAWKGYMCSAPQGTTPKCKNLYYDQRTGQFK